jgi:cupin superfamily acireductone dioxygenase involved in methionine salvage
MATQKTITDVFNAMIRNWENYYELSFEDKEAYFFILNRYFSKIYPEKAQLLNDKLVDKASCMDIWFEFMKSQPYPKDFWSKSENVANKKEKDVKKAEKNLFSQKDLVSLQQKLKIRDEEMQILIKYHADEVKEEIKYIKSLIEK